jgi:hypothetical protein
MKKWLVIAVVIFSIGVGGFIYFRQRLNQENTNGELIYNPEIQKGEKYNCEDPIEGDRDKYRRIAKAAKQLLLTL